MWFRDKSRRSGNDERSLGMTTAFSLRASALGLSLALVACGGGGGGSTGGGGFPPTPTPTPQSTPAYQPCPTGSAFTKTSIPTTGPLTIAPPPVLSTFTFNSNPSGIPVTITFPNATTTQGLGPAPVATQPPVAHTPYTVTWSGSAAPFTVAIDQSQNGDHSLLYNQASDTNGTINLSTIASSARSTQTATGTRSTKSDDIGRPVQRQNGRPSLSPNRLFVRYDTAYVRTSHAHLIASEDELGMTATADIGEFGGVTDREVTIPPSESIAEATNRLSRLSGVKSVERVHLRYTSSCAGLTANNPHFLPDQQWDMYQIGAPNAWGYTKGDAITIAIIDTGIDNYLPQLTNKLSYQEQVLGGVTSPGAHFAQDTDGHGTNVAGIALAEVNDGLGFAGVGYNVKLQAYKIFPNDTTLSGEPPGADTGDEATAIRDAVLHGADVINLSLGSQQDTRNTDGSTGVDIVEHDAIEYAISQGVVVVAAAGNEGDMSVANLDYPANDDNVISVGATSLHDNNTRIPSSSNIEYVAAYSNSAPNLSVVAPGGDPINQTTDSDYLHWIYNISTTTATYKDNKCKNPADCKALFAGTSQATPHVSGTIALMLAAAGGPKSLTVGQITQLIQSTADNINDPKQGHGRINAYRAIAAAAGDPQPPAYVPNANQFVAFAYTNSGGTSPTIANLDFPHGVPVTSNGNFRIADVPPLTGNFKIGVWYDSNGDGVIDAGDLFGSVQTTCSSQANVCGSPQINVARVGSNFTLP